MRTASVVALIVLAVPLAARAQEHAPAPEPPPGWVWHHDAEARLASGAVRDARDSAWTFVQMPPGWHITTGPGSVLHHPDAQATGRYALSAQMHLFKRPTDEGYGLFLGGRGMSTDTASYVAVLLRRDGAVGIEARRGADVRTVAPWTTHRAVTPNPGDQIVMNALRVDVGADSLRVFVNDSTVLAVPRAGLETDGQFGFRVGRGLNLHVTTLDHTRHLAPVPAAREP